jgi:hypothetical protein
MVPAIALVQILLLACKLIESDLPVMLGTGRAFLRPAQDEAGPAEQVVHTERLQLQTMQYELDSDLSTTLAEHHTVLG